jgi:hypothetical protein
MKLDKAYVEMQNGCINVYLDRGWPPEMPPIVRACRRRVRELFEFFREYGVVQGVGAVEIPASCIHAAAALAVMLYAADFDKSFDKSVAHELCGDAPDTIKALIADAVRWSERRDAATASRYCRKPAAALKEIAEVWLDSKKSTTLDEYA